jgi:predicted phosphate transport protein (TIGR00153 family)
MRSAPTTADPGLLGLFEASAQNVEDTARLLHALLADYPEHAGLATDILRCEHDGDRIAHEIKAQLARDGTGGALEPADVHALADALDDIVDHAEEAADQLSLYAVEAPIDSAQRMAEILTGCAAEVAGALHDLMVGADLGPHLAAIHELEHAGDQVMRAAVAALFADGIDPMTVIRWKAIFETLEAAVDDCERVADVLEAIVLKAGRRARVMRQRL